MESLKAISRREILKLTVAAGVGVTLQKQTACLASTDQPRATIQNRAEYAKQRFLKSMNCSQAILETYAEDMGMPVENARKVAAAFAGGMGFGAECGTVTGAFMVIGMKHGKTADVDSDADKETFSRVARFVEEFKREHGEILCSKLLGTDMAIPEGIKKAADQELFTAVCPKFVETACRILDRILS
jgi:C_GCAxxG_C_C family probable redox protein